MLRRLAILPLLLCCLHAMAQTTEHPWEFFWQQMVTADDAEAQIANLLKALNVDAEVKLEPWQQADRLTFPIAIPTNAKPL